ncbi:MAG: hypothetical protein AAGA30_06025 [Planctomycetota bacterium]
MTFPDMVNINEYKNKRGLASFTVVFAQPLKTNEQNSRITPLLNNATKDSIYKIQELSRLLVTRHSPTTFHHASLRDDYDKTLIDSVAR